MANKKIKELELATAANDADDLIIEDAAKTKRIQFGFLTKAIGQLLNPVGSIKLTVSNINPSTYIGGTWIVWGAGRVPVGIDTSQTEFNAIEKAGGVKSQAIAIANLPAHNHGLNNHTHGIPALSGTAASAGIHDHDVKFTRTAASGSAIIRPDAMGTGVAQATGNAGAHTHSVVTNASTTGGNAGTTANAGSGTAFNNLQPYITCYMWKRTA